MSRSPLLRLSFLTEDNLRFPLPQQTRMPKSSRRSKRREEEEEEEDDQMEITVGATQDYDDELIYDPDQDLDERRALRQDYRELQENGE